ncbi:hypothetical protein ACOSQ3_006756 [Xanthoceras sorbifolium]
MNSEDEQPWHWALGVSPPFQRLLVAGALVWVKFGRSVHGYALKMGFGWCVFVASSLTDMYGKCGLLDDAKKV